MGSVCIVSGSRCLRLKKKTTKTVLAPPPNPADAIHCVLHQLCKVRTKTIFFSEFSLARKQEPKAFPPLAGSAAPIPANQCRKTSKNVHQVAAEEVSTCHLHHE